MRKYLIDNDRVKLENGIKEGKTIDEIKKSLALFVQPKAVDAYIAASAASVADYVAAIKGEKAKSKKPIAADSPAKK